MKIGLTMNLNVAFWANGMQQNIAFLHDLLNRVGYDCEYISIEDPQKNANIEDKYTTISDLMAPDGATLDVLIIAGFDLLPDMYDKLKMRNPNLKVILIHYGNKMMDDIHYAICAPDSKRTPLAKPRHLSQIWMSPQHEYGLEYIKSYYNCENVHITPFLWEQKFMQDKMRKLGRKGFSPTYSRKRANRLMVFEPNISHLKNCILPLMISDKFNSMYPNEIEGISLFCTQNIERKKYYKSLVNGLSISKIPNFIRSTGRWASLDALSKFGCTVLSHQYGNDLNYAYLEALYLGLPLIHNSPRLSDVGYYYNDFNVSLAANQIKNSLINHESTLTKYLEDGREFVKQYDPSLPQNSQPYIDLLSNA